MGFLESFKDVIKVANRVVSLGDRVNQLANAVARDSERKDVRIRELEDRLLKVETVLEMAMKTGMIKLPAPN